MLEHQFKASDVPYTEYHIAWRCRPLFAKGRGDSGRRFLPSKRKIGIPTFRSLLLAAEPARIRMGGFTPSLWVGDPPSDFQLAPPSFPIGSPIAREQEPGSSLVGWPERLTDQIF
jgi:hypothetical protein